MSARDLLAIGFRWADSETLHPPSGSQVRLVRLDDRFYEIRITAKNSNVVSVVVPEVAIRVGRAGNEAATSSV